MPIPETPVPFAGSPFRLPVVAVASFLGGEVVATRFHVGRDPYLPVLALVTTGVLAVCRVAWDGMELVPVLTAWWGRAVLAALSAPEVLFGLPAQGRPWAEFS